LTSPLRSLQISVLLFLLTTLVYL